MNTAVWSIWSFANVKSLFRSNFCAIKSSAPPLQSSACIKQVFEMLLSHVPEANERSNHRSISVSREEAMTLALSLISSVWSPALLHASRFFQCVVGFLIGSQFWLRAIEVTSYEINVFFFLQTIKTTKKMIRAMLHFGRQRPCRNARSSSRKTISRPKCVGFFVPW